MRTIRATISTDLKNMGLCTHQREREIEMRLTKQRWDTLLHAMCYWETMLEEGEEIGGTAKERRQFESTMEYLLSIKPQEKESK